MNLISIFKFGKYIRNLLNLNYNSKKYVLIEVFEQTPSLISFLFFFISLNKKKNLKPLLYKPTLDNYYKDKFKEFIPLSIINLYKNFFRTKTILHPRIKIKKNQKEIVKILKKIKSKNDLVNLKINNIWVGDLFYDNYLRSKDLITIDVTSESFKREMKKYISLYFFWENYFKIKKIDTIIFSHSVYLIGLPARIAVYNKIKAYLVRASDVVMLSKKYLHAYDGYKDYPKLFNKLDKREKRKALKLAQTELSNRFSGKSDKLTEKNQPNEISPFSEKNINLNFIKKNKKIRILVATHDFNDAIHIYGKNLFCDFHDWLVYLGEFSLNKNFEWLIKFHPADYDGNLDKAKKIISKYNNFKILDKFVTHNKLIESGIDCVLTVYGSIGHEYPLLNIPVINAGNNPHIGYDFNYNPKNKNQYLKYLNNIKKLKVNQNIRKKIYEFYYINFLTDFSPLNDLTPFYSSNDQKKIFDHLINKNIQKRGKKIIDIYYEFIKFKKRKLSILKNV